MHPTPQLPLAPSTTSHVDATIGWPAYGPARRQRDHARARTVRLPFLYKRLPDINTAFPVDRCDCICPCCLCCICCVSGFPVHCMCCGSADTAPFLRSFEARAKDGFAMPYMHRARPMVRDTCRFAARATEMHSTHYDGPDACFVFVLGLVFVSTLVALTQHDRRVLRQAIAAAPASRKPTTCGSSGMHWQRDRASRRTWKCAR